ncbi:PEPxxWA-CTERM sorting domain-containing protein [Sphingobium nicotianae]|uniref:PEP-CTERM sorting domain-containing protein n=1 Tax=Sphingobium nicotianae TaxID=2782607 RepID=A0A9X1D9C7_9SPHN|nr:PEPxxWA-CTERM sorting domain-containing protein [Sphingobium nicotianae]MBT2185421.1 PEP-CTERM sorting domain-containing protein [Sphingobium nicotianae]
MKKLLVAVALAVVAVPAAAQTVSNTNAIGIVDGGEVTSDIVVAGLSGNITSLTLSINSLSHTYPDDLVFGLLNTSANLGFVFLSGVGGSADIRDVDLTFSDSASGFLPESFVDAFPVTSGTYLPSNFYLYEFTFYPNATAFGDFAGITPNGTWTLVVDDTFPADTGTISGGWSLTFTTDATAAVPEPATWAMMIGGLALAGATMRRRQVRVAFAA